MIGDLYFVYSSVEVEIIEKNIYKDEVIDAICNFSPFISLRYLPRHYHFKQLDDTLYAIYFIADENARPAYYFSTSSNYEKTEEKILCYDRSIRML